MHARRRPTRAALLSTAALVATGALLLTGISAVSAADGDVPSGPVTLQQRTADVVTADPLPTVQIDNGYVWAQAMIGDTVYAVGGFANARAPLAAPGTNLTPRSNILAYDITNGNLLPFAPQVNGVIRAVAASPDGSRIYIGGSFNSVNGETRWNFAALNASTGQLVPGFNPSIGGSGVYAMAVLGDSVYMTGLFTQANGVARTNLAAFATSNGALRPWAPTTDLQGDAMVIDPGGSHVIAGGRFYQVNGVVQRGLVALDPVTGAIDTAWAASDTIINGWNSGGSAGKAGIFALTADASGVYGTGWVYANVTVGNLEGVFAAEAGTGDIRWVADCHGDHYGVYSTGEIVYATSHTHQCDTVGLAPELSPRTYRYVEAFSATAEGTLTRSPSVSSIYKDWSGTPAPQPYSWYPDFLIGHTSGLNQAGLSMTGNGEFLAVAGEFSGVNNQRYEGIVRFSTNPQGGANQGPRIPSAEWGAPAASSVVAGRARVSIDTNWDRDDRDLTYELRRSGTPGVVQAQTIGSGWWPQSQSRVQFDDTGLTPGSTQTYTVRVVDGDGNAVTSQPVTVTVGDGVASDYVDAVLDDGASLYYPLGNIDADWAGGGDPVFGGGTSSVTPGAVSGTTGATSTSFNGNSNGRVSSPAAAVSAEFSAEVWFNTTTNRGGKLIGYGSSRTGASSSYDRHLYMQNNGRLTFGAYPGGVRTVSSAQSYNDGQWHHAVATQSAAGMTLYVDGVEVGNDPATTTAQSYSGYWRIGGDNLNGWPNRPSSDYFSGRIDEAAVYPTALAAGQVMAHYATGLGQAAPAASFTSTADNLVASFDGSGSTADTGATISGYAWDFGDGTPAGSGATPTHTYADAGTYPVTLTVTDSRGVTGAATQSITVAAANVSPTASFTSTVDGLAVAVNGLGSSDPDGSIASYAWNWGDGSAAGSGATASHTYATPGSHTITLTVTDDRGAQATTSETVDATHADPTASFTASASGLRADVDGASSAASDGATLSYAWNWGDGASGSGVTASHTYAASGTYTVGLTVTDSLGATAATTREISVSEVAFAARDDFERTVASGWGNADTGGTWSAMHGSASVASVGGGDGILTLSAGQTRNMALQGLSIADSSTTVGFSIDQAPATGNNYVGIAARQSAAQNYTVRAWMRSNGGIWLVAQRSGSNGVLATQPLSTSWAAGDDMQLRVQVTGASPTTVQAKLWPTGSTEPADWQLTVTDSTAGLQAAGWVSLHANRSGSSTSTAEFAFDGLRVADPNGGGGEPANVDPVASFTSTVSNLQVAVDGTASSDADGTIAQHSWNWGDGTADSTGSTATHDYAAAGTYTVTLTVTDDDGATATSVDEVVVTAPDPGNEAPTAAFTATVDDLDLAVDASASTDSDGTIVSYAWNWGDGTAAGSGSTASHSYAADGTYTVTLTVTDDGGATAVTSDSVVATAPVVPPGDFAAQDDFARTVAQGWGDADTGGAWSVASGSSTPLSVADGVGQLALSAGSTRNVMLGDVDLQDVRLSVDFSLDQAPSTGTAYFGLLARSTGGDDYRTRVWLRDNGSVWLVLQHGTTVLRAYPVPGLTRTAGDSFSLAVEVTGTTSTTFSASIWRTGSTQPATWQVTANDAAGPDASGAVGVHSNRSGAASTTALFTVDAFRVTDLG